jgi:hypothetical protein
VSSGLLRPSRPTRAERARQDLEAQRERKEEREAPRGAAAVAWRRAEELASAGELEELARLEALALAQEPESLELLALKQQVWALSERLMDRVAPTLATFYRSQRDLVSRALKVLAEEAETDLEDLETGDLDLRSIARRVLKEEGGTAELAAWEMRVSLERLQWRTNTLETLRVRREALLGAGAEPITDLDEGSRLVGELLAALDTFDTQRATNIVHTEGAKRRVPEGRPKRR